MTGGLGQRKNIQKQTPTAVVTNTAPSTETNDDAPLVRAISKPGNARYGEKVAMPLYHTKSHDDCLLFRLGPDEAGLLMAVNSSSQADETSALRRPQARPCKTVTQASTRG